MAHIAIIGAGFSGLSAACYLAKAGHKVEIFEKNATPGGRARQLKTSNGYVFDMGPSWYWMPDVFERFFEDFETSVTDFYSLKQLDPAFEIVFPQNELLKVPADYESLSTLFESIEEGSAQKLERFLQDGQIKYELGMQKLVYKPGLSVFEFLDAAIIRGALKMDITKAFSKHVRRYFSNPKLVALMEFPVLFLGAMPKDTPALYSLMNYAALKLGTWYPSGGFGKIIESMVLLAEQQGASFHFNASVKRIIHNKNRLSGVVVDGKELSFDAVISSADYQHTEASMLAPEVRNYSGRYWDKKTFAPSCLIFYLGLNKRIKQIEHHTLFFEEDLEAHSQEIYKDPKWPSEPLFYVCCPSQSDNTVAPEGHENLFMLMPIATDLHDSSEMRELYFEIMVERLEKHVGEDILPYIDYKKSYCVADFKTDYNSFKGNAYGLANTLKQTANLKPKIKNHRIENLFYTGQLTVPGPGVPPALVSGKLSAQQVELYLSRKHEAVV